MIQGFSSLRLVSNLGNWFANIKNYAGGDTVKNFWFMQKMFDKFFYSSEDLKLVQKLRGAIISSLLTGFFCVYGI